MDGSFFSALLTMLGVRHTGGYSDARFGSMPFHTLFGLTALLKEYGVASSGVRLSHKEDLRRLPLPVIIPVKHTYLIVTAIRENCIEYQSVRTSEHMPLADFLAAWDGTALLLQASHDACEPDYCRHRLGEVMRRLRNIGLWVMIFGVVIAALCCQGLVKSAPAIVLALLYMGGIALSYMLVQKSVGLHSKHADRVCSVLQAGGCDTIARSRASTFLEIFHWSEVGLTYFSVSLAVMLLFPSQLPGLALFNILALPYTAWSIFYQRFRAKAWCTMCVGVQITLWLTFFCMIWGGWCSQILPLQWSRLWLGAAYVLVMLALNRLDEFISRLIPKQ